MLRLRGRRHGHERGHINAVNRYIVVTVYRVENVEVVRDVDQARAGEVNLLVASYVLLELGCAHQRCFQRCRSGAR